MPMAFLKKKREEPRVDLTPMVDVVFLLLIFFMISTTFVESPGLNIQLPKSSAGQLEKGPEEFKVFLSREGEVFVHGAPVSMGDLRQQLQGMRSTAPSTTFILSADQNARHGRVVELMDLARESGFGRLAIETEAKPVSEISEPERRRN